MKKLLLATLFCFNAFAYEHLGLDLGFGSSSLFNFEVYYQKYNTNDLAFNLSYAHSSQKRYWSNIDTLKVKNNILSGVVGQSIKLDVSRANVYLNALAGGYYYNYDYIRGTNSGFGLKAGLNLNANLTNELNLGASLFIHKDLGDLDDTYFVFDLDAKYLIDRNLFVKAKLSHNDSSYYDASAFSIGIGYKF